MEVITQENNTGDLTRKFVRDGVAGNVEIVYEMIRVIRNSVSYDIVVEHLAKDLLKNKGMTSYSPTINQLTAIYDFVKSNVKYIQDPAGLIESIKSAKVTLADGYGDCDDLTNTVATLVGDLGFEKVCIVMARYSEDNPTFEHVYPVVYDKGERYVLDASLPNGKVNDEVEAVEIREISIFDDVPGLDGLTGIFNNLKYHTKKLGRAAVETLPMVGEFLPLGFVAGKAFATGAQLLNQSHGQPLSINATGSKIIQELDKIIVSLIQSRTAFDLAKSHALQIASQLGAVERSNSTDTVEAYQAVKSTIENKLNFIKNFESFAAEHDIKIVHLSPHGILCVGALGASVGAYALYKLWKGR